MKDSVPLDIHCQQLISKHGSVRAASVALDIEHAYLHRLSTGQKINPSVAMLKKLGLGVLKTVTYYPLNKRK